MLEVGSRQKYYYYYYSGAEGFPATKINRNTYRWSAAMVSRGSSSCGWTNERHVNFLNSMEASFVRTILQNNVSAPLDRYIPDSSESTLDHMNNQRRTMAPRTHSTSGKLNIISLSFYPLASFLKLNLHFSLSLSIHSKIKDTTSIMSL